MYSPTCCIRLYEASVGTMHVDLTFALLSPLYTAFPNAMMYQEQATSPCIKASDRQFTGTLIQ